MRTQWFYFGQRLHSFRLPFILLSAYAQSPSRANERSWADRKCEISWQSWHDLQSYCDFLSRWSKQIVLAKFDSVHALTLCIYRAQYVFGKASRWFVYKRLFCRGNDGIIVVNNGKCVRFCVCWIHFRICSAICLVMLNFALFLWSTQRLSKTLRDSDKLSYKRITKKCQSNMKRFIISPLLHFVSPEFELN